MLLKIFLNYVRNNIFLNSEAKLSYIGYLEKYLKDMRTFFIFFNVYFCFIFEFIDLKKCLNSLHMLPLGSARLLFTTFSVQWAGLKNNGRRFYQKPRCETLKH